MVGFIKIMKTKTSLKSIRDVLLLIADIPVNRGYIVAHKKLIDLGKMPAAEKSIICRKGRRMSCLKKIGRAHV